MSARSPGALRRALLAASLLCVIAPRIFAEGNGFYIATHGTVRVESESASALVGDGADGLILNFGLVDASTTGSALIFAIRQSKAG